MAIAFKVNSVASLASSNWLLQGAFSLNALYDALSEVSSSSISSRTVFPPSQSEPKKVSSAHLNLSSWTFYIK